MFLLCNCCKFYELLIPFSFDLPGSWEGVRWMWLWFKCCYQEPAWALSWICRRKLSFCWGIKYEGGERYTFTSHGQMEMEGARLTQLRQCICPFISSWIFVVSNNSYHFRSKVGMLSYDLASMLHLSRRWILHQGLLLFVSSMDQDSRVVLLSIKRFRKRMKKGLKGDNYVSAFCIGSFPLLYKS